MFVNDRHYQFYQNRSIPKIFFCKFVGIFLTKKDAGFSTDSYPARSYGDVPVRNDDDERGSSEGGG